MIRTRFMLAAIGLLAFYSSAALAQRAPVASATPTTQQKGPGIGVSVDIPPPPPTVKAKYEGGIFGYNNKIDGTLHFDDVNNRLIFRDKKTKSEKISLNYDVIVQAFADVQSKRPVAADIASRVSIFGLPAMLIKKKYRYLTLQFSDEYSNANGITSFKLENQQILDSVLAALAKKAGLVPRGEIFVRPKNAAKTDANK